MTPLFVKHANTAGIPYKYLETANGTFVSNINKQETVTDEAKQENKLLHGIILYYYFNVNGETYRGSYGKYLGKFCVFHYEPLNPIKKNKLLLFQKVRRDYSQPRQIIRIRIGRRRSGVLDRELLRNNKDIERTRNNDNLQDETIDIDEFENRVSIELKDTETRVPTKAWRDRDKVRVGPKAKKRNDLKGGIG